MQGVKLISVAVHLTLQVNLMAIKRTAEKAKQESETAVMRELTKKSPQRWSDLLKTTQLSSRTLKKALNRLEKKGLTYRQMEQGEEYPPPVFYGLSPKGEKSTIPLLFSIDARPYILGLRLEWRIRDNTPKKKSVIVEIKKEKESLEERIALIGKRLGVFYLFSLLKALEEKNMDWLVDTKDFLDFRDLFMHMTFDIDFPKQKWSGRVEDIEGHLTLPLPKTNVIPKKKEIKKIKKKLKQVYPDEIRAFEEMIRGAKTKT